MFVLKYFGPARVRFQLRGWPRMEATAAKRVLFILKQIKFWPKSEMLVLKHFGPARVSFQPRGWHRMEATAAKRVLLILKPNQISRAGPGSASILGGD
jgi:hypothetical protein